MVTGARRSPRTSSAALKCGTQNQQTLVLLTNQLIFGSTTIAAIYKDRWQIEIFFKVIKQTLRIKTFVETSVNALHVRLWTALITILLLKILKLRSTFAWSISNFVAMLRFSLFTYLDLWEWLNKPFASPPCGIESMQLCFFPMALGQHPQG
jgi:IS4 transposase